MEIDAIKYFIVWTVGLWGIGTALFIPGFYKLQSKIAGHPCNDLPAWFPFAAASAWPLIAVARPQFLLRRLRFDDRLDAGDAIDLLPE